MVQNATFNATDKNRHLSATSAGTSLREAVRRAAMPPEPYADKKFTQLPTTSVRLPQRL